MQYSKRVFDTELIIGRYEANLIFNNNFFFLGFLHNFAL